MSLLNASGQLSNPRSTRSVSMTVVTAFRIIGASSPITLKM